MSLSIPTPILSEIHKLASDGSILITLEVPDYDIYLVRNNEDILWNDRTYQAFPFELAAINVNTQGKMPECVIRIHDQDGVVERWIDQYNGFMGSECTISVLSSKCLTETEPIYSITLEILKPHCDIDLIEIKLGIDNPILHMYPPQKMHATLCQYQTYKGDECAYDGPETTCDREWTTCVGYGNEERFGGQPGIIGTITEE